MKSKISRFHPVYSRRSREICFTNFTDDKFVSQIYLKFLLVKILAKRGSAYSSTIIIEKNIFRDL